MAATPSILPHLGDLFPHTIDALAVTREYDGTITLTGTGNILAIPCRIAQPSQNKIVKGRDGKDVTSTLKVTCGAVNGLSVEDFVYTLPSQYSPRSNLESIAVAKPSDENGVHHEVLWFA